MVSTKNAAFIVTPVFDKHYACFEEVFFSNFLSIQMKLYCYVLNTTPWHKQLQKRH